MAEALREIGRLLALEPGNAHRARAYHRGAQAINIGADLAAVAEAIGLLVDGSVRWVVAPLAVALVAVQVLGRHRTVANVLRWLCLVLLVYVIEVFVVRPPLGETLRATFVPTLSGNRRYLTTLVAILGTTISPYLFFWQATQEVEEERAKGRRSVAARRGATDVELDEASIDVNTGMLLSNVVMYCIILVTATTLHANGHHDVRSGADAARALEPLAGRLAEGLFAIGMIGTGLLAVPVLSGSAAYATATLFRWRAGFDEPWHRARSFYAVVAAATFGGALLNVTRIAPMDALYWAAVLNGALAPPLLVLMMLAARDPHAMGDRRIGPILTVLGWASTGGMALALLGLVYTSLR